MCSSEKFLIIYNYLSFIKFKCNTGKSSPMNLTNIYDHAKLSSFRINFSFIHLNLLHTIAVLFYLLNNVIENIRL